MKAVVSLWAQARDLFSAHSLELTSPSAPTTLEGGLPLVPRALVTVATLALATGLAVLVGAPFGVIFFFPALVIAGLFGGAELGLAALAVTVILINMLLSSPSTWLLDLVAAMQLGIGVLARSLFRESRRWGVRYRRLLSAISTATTISKPDGAILRPHPELGKLIGMDWPAYSGQGWRDAFHADDIPGMTPATPGNDGKAQRAEVRIRDPNTGDWHWYYMRAVPLFDDDGNVVEWISALTDIHQTKLAREHQQMVIGEARHRLKNLITVIESLAKSSRPKKEPAVDEFMRKFSGRLHALSAAGDLALASNYSMIDTQEIVAATLSPFLQTEASRLTFGGPKIALSEATGGGLALGVHELATNAIKYGALSVADGRVAFTWHAEDLGNDERIVMEWVETGGRNTPAEREGFGTRLIKFTPSRERNGNVDIEYRPEGYYCRISFIRPKAAAEPTG